MPKFQKLEYAVNKYQREDFDQVARECEFVVIGPVLKKGDRGTLWGIPFRIID